MEFIAVCLILGVSLALNFWGCFYIERRGRQWLAELEAAKKAPTPTISAEELLHDLTRGSAIIRVERISPADVMLRSPRT